MKASISVTFTAQEVAATAKKVVVDGIGNGTAIKLSLSPDNNLFTATADFLASMVLDRLEETARAIVSDKVPRPKSTHRRFLPPEDGKQAVNGAIIEFTP